MATEIGGMETTLDDGTRGADQMADQMAGRPLRVTRLLSLRESLTPQFWNVCLGIVPPGV